MYMYNVIAMHLHIEIHGYTVPQYTAYVITLASQTCIMAIFGEPLIKVYGFLKYNYFKFSMYVVLLCPNSAATLFIWISST